jgi:hypothetical protein
VVADVWLALRFIVAGLQLAQLPCCVSIFTTAHPDYAVSDEPVSGLPVRANFRRLHCSFLRWPPILSHIAF